MIAAIPTLYNGVQFRSRLEARWAAFFDARKEYWEYEPVDYAGWIPDFYYLTDKNGQFNLVEVKPIREFSEAVAMKCLAAVDNKREIMLFGENPAYTWTISRFHDGELLVNGDMVVEGLNGYGCSPPPVGLPVWERFWKTAGNQVQWKRKQ